MATNRGTGDHMGLKRTRILRLLQESGQQHYQSAATIPWEKLERLLLDFLPIRNALASHAWGIAESLCSGARAPAFRIAQKSDETIAADLLLLAGPEAEDYDLSLVSAPVELLVLWYSFDQWIDIHESLINTWNMKGKPTAYIKKDKSTSKVCEFEDHGCEIVEQTGRRYGVEYRIGLRYLRREVEITVRTADIYEDLQHRCRREQPLSETHEPYVAAHAFLLDKARETAQRITSLDSYAGSDLDLSPSLTQPQRYAPASDQSRETGEISVSENEPGALQDTVSSPTSIFSPERMEATAPLHKEFETHDAASADAPIRTGVRGEIVINPGGGRNADDAKNNDASSLDATIPLRKDDADADHDS